MYRYLKNKGNKTISQELNNSVIVGRATAQSTSSPVNHVQAIAETQTPELRDAAPAKSIWEKYADPTNYQIQASDSRKLLNKKPTEDQPLIKQIHLDLSFARIGSLAMFARSILSGLFDSSRENDPETSKTKTLDIVDDYLHKLRQQSQYSIHAQPGSDRRKPDDIASDGVENMVAASLGNNVYKVNAFVAPWLSLFKTFFPYNDNPVWGLIPRMVDFVDNSSGKLTNIFWNIRRLGKAFVAYDGGIDSTAFRHKQNEVREVINYYTNRILFKNNSKLFKPLINLWHKLFSTDQHHSNTSPLTSGNDHNIQTIKEEMAQNFWNNIKAVGSATYNCAHQGGIPKVVGSEEPENQTWYVRLKIASKCLGFPAGAIGALLNTAGIGLNFLGSFFNIEPLRVLSDKSTDIANGLMSLVYLTGEVPANLNEFIKKGKEKTDLNRHRNLAVFAIGALGMLNRIKVLPGIKTMMNLVKVKPLLDRFDKTLRHFFLFFFSYNRLVLHSDEKAIEAQTAPIEELQEAEMHNNLRAHLLLPFRVLMNDKQVSHSKTA
ncbi:MAG: hypothetical protein HOA17_06680 [Candidatus Melainabacteria bacterium]|nr:hypothetical protein [Candidatus Melainabacteria bacterium]